jgi:hypothetical protein
VTVQRRRSMASRWCAWPSAPRPMRSDGALPRRRSCESCAVTPTPGC